MTDLRSARARDIGRRQIDHVGLFLWRAHHAFEAEKGRRLAAAGFADVLASDANLLPHLDVEGSRLTELARRIGVSKQAVHQALKGLVERAYVEVSVDPSDGRARIVRYTPKGLRYIEAAQHVKKDMQDGLVAAMGATSVIELTRLLTAVERTLAGADEERVEAASA